MSESGVKRGLTDREVERNIGMNEWIYSLVFIIFITMDKSFHPKTIERILLRLIKIDYPSVEGVKITHTFSDERNVYLVRIGVEFNHTIRNNYYEFIPYVNNIGRYIVPHPDILRLEGLYYPCE
jgi:hypothetical protein